MPNTLTKLSTKYLITMTSIIMVPLSLSKSKISSMMVLKIWAVTGRSPKLKLKNSLVPWILMEIRESVKMNSLRYLARFSLKHDLKNMYIET